MIRLTGDNPCRREHTEGLLAWSEQARTDFDLMEAFAAGLLLIDENLQILRSNDAGRRWLGPGGDSFARLLGQSVGAPPQELRRQIREAVVKGVRCTLLLKAANPGALICSIMPMNEAAS